MKKPAISSRLPRTIAVTLVASALLNALNAADWPQWRGPQRNSISAETGLAKEWPKEGPKLIWQVNDLGSGFSTPAVVGQFLYLLGNEGLENEYVTCRSVADGRRVWQTRLGKVGPNIPEANYAAARSTPTVEQGVLYSLGSDGDLACLDTESGKVRWKKNLRTDFGGKPGIWAYAESPLIDGDTLVCTPGGSEATIIGLNKETGAIAWKCILPEGDPAAFSSPILVDAAGMRQYVLLLQNGLVGIEAGTGKFLWRYSKPVSQFKANIPTPVASDGIIYVASAGTGGGAVKLKPRPGGVDVEQLYFESKMPTAIGGVIKVGNYLYGTTGSAMICLEFATGKIKWEERAMSTASLLLADGRLYLHGENGEVGLVEPSPESYRERGRFTPPNAPKHTAPGEKAWAYPVVANGRLYIRDLGSMWCYEAKKP